MPGTHKNLQHRKNFNHWTFSDLVVDLNYFTFSQSNPNPNPTHLPKHEFLRPKNQFCQRIWYVEYYSVHAFMVWRQKFRLTPDPNSKVSEQERSRSLNKWLRPTLSCEHFYSHNALLFAHAQYRWEQQLLWPPLHDVQTYYIPCSCWCSWSLRKGDAVASEVQVRYGSVVLLCSSIPSIAFKWIKLID